MLLLLCRASGTLGLGVARLLEEGWGSACFGGSSFLSSCWAHLFPVLGCHAGSARSESMPRSLISLRTQGP